MGIIIVTVAVALFCSVPSIQHFISVHDPCYLANTCNHTWDAECGYDNSNSQRRMFLDECDRFEYNCDFKRAYVRAEMTECKTFENRHLTTVFTTTTTIAPPTTDSSTASTPVTITTTKSTKTDSTTTSTTTETPVTTTSVTETTTVSVPTTTVSTEVLTETTISTQCTRPINKKIELNIETVATKPMTTESLELTTTSATNSQSITANTTMTESPTTLASTQTAESSTTTADSTSNTTETSTNTTSAVTTENATTVSTTAKMSPCNVYPKHCDRPVTWETTVEGETRDFFQILRERYGRRARLMKFTTHWPKNLGLHLRNSNAAFSIGNHIERRSDTK